MTGINLPAPAVTDLDLAVGERPRKTGGTALSGKTLRFALAMFGACVVVSLFVGGVLPEFSGPSARVSMRPMKPATPGAAPRAAPTVAANVLTYRADASGHFYIDAFVNGAPIRFLLDSGATFVALSPDDAAAAGIATQSLRFDAATATANGIAHVAPTTLRSVRLGQFELNDVSAVVTEHSLPVSLLGMSFLSRTNAYTIRDGVLTIEW